jgi:hypothetical protein
VGLRGREGEREGELYIGQLPLQAPTCSECHSVGWDGIKMIAGFLPVIDTIYFIPYWALVRILWMFTEFFQ